MVRMCYLELVFAMDLKASKIVVLGSSLLKTHGAFVLKSKSNGAVISKSTAYVVLSL
jgi:hypothetical protein